VYVEDGALIPLDDYLSQAGIKAEEGVDVDWQSGIINGKIWALPLNSSGADHMMFYNLKHYEEDDLDPNKPPATWDEMRDFAKKMTKSEGGEITRLGVQIGASSWDWLYYIAQNDGEWLSTDGRTVIMDNPKSVEALQYVVDIFDIQGGWEKVTAFLGIARQTEPFIADVVANYTSGQWVNYYIMAGNPELRYGTAVAPRNQGPWTAESYGPQQWTIPAGVKHPDLSFALSLWLSRGSGGCQFLAPQMMPSAWKACNDSNAFAKAAHFWPTIEAAFATTRPTTPTPVFNQFLSIWDEMMQQALLKASTPAEAITWATGEMVKTSDEYWAKHSG
jgi:multiple sugar transport system substrate-binding protein